MKPNKKASEMSVKELARYIDHSVLKPEFTQDEIAQHIADGVAYGCATVCVNPASVAMAAKLCAGSDTKVCPVCDFPFGTSSTESKVQQAKIILNEYASAIGELDMVANFGWIRSGMWDQVTADIKAVVDVCHAYQVAVKVILETDALTSEEVRKACLCVVDAGADFVKTSTGFLSGHEAVGASVEIVKLMMDTVAGKAKVKGSGCIRTREHFLALVDMGIDRMGIGYKSTPVVLGLDKEQTSQDNY